MDADLAGVLAILALVISTMAVAFASVAYNAIRAGDLRGPQGWPGPTGAAGPKGEPAEMWVTVRDPDGVTER